MSGDSRIDELLQQAEALPDGPIKISVLEEAIREADVLGNRELAFRARRMLAWPATFSGFPEKLVVAFSWCLAQADRDNETFDENELLWDYKWVLENLEFFPQVSRDQIFRMHDDYEARLQRHGYSLRPVLGLRWVNHMRMGRFAEALEAMERWKLAKRDSMADCPACEQYHVIEYLLLTGQDKQALRKAEPILSGRLWCHGVPHRTLGIVLRPLLRLGKHEQARDCHQRGYRMASRNRVFLPAIAEYLLYRIHTGDNAGGVRLVEKHVGWAAETSNLRSRFDFYVATALLFEQLGSSAGRRPTRKVRLPRELACRREDDTYVPADLAGWFHEQAADLAQRFNRRNGNDYFTRRIHETRQFALG